MRRIYACVLVLGVGGLGFGLMRSLAQTTPPVPVAPHEKPIAQSAAPMSRPDLRPTTYDIVRNGPRPTPGLQTAAWEDAQPPESQPPADPAPAPRPGPTEPEPAVPPTNGPGERASPAPPSSLPALDPAAVPAPPKPAIEPRIELPGAMPDLVLPKLPPAEPSAPPLPAPESIKPRELDPPLTPKTPAEVPSELNVNPPPAVGPSPGTAPMTAPAVPLRGVAPAVNVEAIVPETIGVGQQLDYQIVVRNVGPVPVHQVRVEDDLPRTVRYVGSEPAGEVTGERIAWNVGSLDVGAERRIKVTVRPGADGDWRTQPQVTFTAAALAMQVRVTKPRLIVKINHPESVTVGDDVPFQIQVTNTGTGPAQALVLKAKLSEGLQHPQGSVIEAELINLRVGETKTVTLKTQAVKTGGHTCALTATADTVTEVSGQGTVQVTPPTLFLRIAGPPRGLVRGEPVFALELTNTAPANSQPVQAAAAFPEGLEFAGASDGGSYDPTTRVVTWSVGPLSANSKRTLSVKARATTAGNWAVRAVAQAAPRTELKAETVIQIDGVPALTFEVVNLENPVEISKEGTYEIRVVNQGTCACTNVRVVVALSEGLVPTALTGPTAYRVEGQLVSFEPVPKLAVRADAVFRVRVKGAQAGDQRCKVQLSCDQLRQPVVKEESTSFYSAQ